MGEDYPRTLMDFEARFASEEACRTYPFALRWPDGFICPRCGGQSAWQMSRGRWLCRGCRLAQQAVHIDPVPFASLVQPQLVGGG